MGGLHGPLRMGGGGRERGEGGDGERRQWIAWHGLMLSGMGTAAG
ncbi:hypothetical protein GCM10008171_21820 [Methylopila jiangsuensis]|uniref:Uncharacterized protein n=1 Tax=Methylopila jiangsuensis TaxID=586230 RepID=A0A9W6JK03_9HYPH|nr:hypothetical protein GCM10008171_21820 [Methylopila jiangsuensis]